MSRWKAVFLLFLLLAGTRAWALSPQALKLLDNRFRVDYGIEAITMLVQRKEYSSPVIVVLPDGSKWYSHRHPKNVSWSEGPGGDMIRVANPTPGPWQLIGQVSENSKILLISDIQLKLDPLPKKVFRGERIKLQASIEGDNNTLSIRDFHKMLKWKVNLVSANRRGDENYAAGVKKIGGFEDDGTKLDERPSDGHFTSSLDFDQPSGLYGLRLEVGNEVFKPHRRPGSGDHPSALQAVGAAEARDRPRRVPGAGQCGPAGSDAGRAASGDPGSCAIGHDG